MIAWGDENEQHFPWRACSTEWTGLLAEILLQRTRATSVVPVWIELCERFPRPEDFTEIARPTIEAILEPLGLKWRIPMIMDTAKLVSERGSVPATRDELQKLPGVGPYVSSAYLSLYAGTRSSIVDANVVRWLCRMIDRQDCNNETRRKKWVIELAEDLTPTSQYRDYNRSLLDLTMTVCTTGKPSCLVCPVSDICRYSLKEKDTE